MRGSNERRVVVVGMGTVNPLGHTVEEFWSNIKVGKSGIGPLTKFDSTDYPAKIAGEVRDFDPSDRIERKEARSLADFSLFALHSASQAMEQAKLSAREISQDPYRTGIYIGNGIGGFEIVEENLLKLFERGPRAVAPLTIPKLIANEAGGNIALKYGIKGPCHTIVTACAAGTDAIGAAYQAIKNNVIDVAVTGGTEAAITQLAVAGFCRLQALSTAYNDLPEQACRPFDHQRDGFVIGEGAAVLVLEEYASAKRRGVPILGEILGYGATCDAFHLTAPNPTGEGPAQAMLLALKQAGLQPYEIDYINAHGTSTLANDVMETAAIKLAFQEHAYEVKISSTKSMTSHLIGAAGAVEALICLLALRDGYYPGTMNLEHPDPECDLNYLPKRGEYGTMRFALSESLGFGGHNGALIFGK